MFIHHTTGENNIFKHLKWEIIFGEFQMYPEKKNLKPVLVLHYPFLRTSFFLEEKRKIKRNNQLSYKTGYNRNSP